MLFSDVVGGIREEYLQLVQKSGFPIEGLTPDRIEVADFGLARGERDDFGETGLGLIVLVNHAECGKVLMFLPGQLLPEHRHQGVVAVPAASAVPAGWVDLSAVVRGFEGLDEFPGGTRYIVPADPGVRQFQSPVDGGTLIPGKQEYFHILYGEGSLYVPGTSTATPAYLPPATRAAYITARREVRLTPGVGYHLDANTAHSVVAGPNGLVLLEFSLTSRDPLDIYTDPAVRRITEVRDRWYPT
jgi:D-lyxose ketol-isomerase